MAQQQQPSRQNNNGRDLQTIPDKRRAYLAEQYGYTPEQIDVVRNMIALGATDSELEFFLATSKRLGLDPFARQVWFVKRPKRVEDERGESSYVNVGEPQTSIDGYRTVAERSGDYEGQGVMMWCGPDGKWVDAWTKKEPPAAARATIFRKGHREPLVNVALFEEFCPKFRNGKSPAMWVKMPANQLAKCAEAGGLRRAFPRDLSGTHTDAEMEHIYTEAGYQAPAKSVESTPTKALDQRHEPATLPRDMTVQGDSVPAGAQPEKTITEENVVAETLASVDLSEIADELDREIARVLKGVIAAKNHDDLQSAGQLITAAKAKIKSGITTDAHANAIVEIIEPALQKRWRETRGAK